MWLVSIHLNFVRFFNSSYKILKLFCEFLCFCLSLRGLFPDCIQYLRCNIFAHHLCALCLSLYHVLLCVFFLYNELRCPLLDIFHLSLPLLLLCLHDYELCLHLVGTGVDPGFNAKIVHQQNPKYHPFRKHLQSR
jgi:hypothetical protein